MTAQTGMREIMTLPARVSIPRAPASMRSPVDGFLYLLSAKRSDKDIRKETRPPGTHLEMRRWLAMCNEHLQKRDDSELEQGERHTGDWKDRMKRRMQGHHALSDNRSPYWVQS